MATAKQIAANRQNAQKSTGPKTAEGKARSRRNALKHGLAGQGIVLSAPDQKRVTQRIASFREKLAPVDELEEYLVTRVAMASVRAERAVERETASVRRRVKRTARRWDEQQEREVRQLAQRLATEPAGAVRGLERSARGCDWLMDEWQALGKALKTQGHWSHASAAHAIRLLGKNPEACCCGSGRVACLRRNFLGALPEVDPEEAEATLGLDPTGLDEAARLEAITSKLPEPDVARQALRVMVQKQVRRLERLARKRWEKIDGPDRAEKLAIAQVDTTIEGVRLLRYESCHEMGVHRNLNELIKIRKQEPEMSSIARWEKTGKKYNRRWDGYCWVPNSEWRTAEEDAGRAGDEPVTASGGSRCSTPGTRSEGHEERRAEADLTGDGPSAVSGPSLRSDPGTRGGGVLSGEEASSRVPGAESKTMPRLLPSEAAERRAGICSDEQPLPWVPGVERSDPPVTVVRSLQAPSRGPDQEPKGDRKSSTASPGQDAAEVWPGLSAARPGTPQPKQEPVEDSGLLAQGPMMASGGSLRSTPGTRPDGPLEGTAEAHLAGHEPMTVSGSSRCSDPATRSDTGAGVRGPGVGEDDPRLAGDAPVMVTGASADAVAPATPSGAVWEGGQKPGLPGDGQVMVSGPSLRSDPGTRSESEERPEFRPVQAIERAAGFSAWREPGVSQPKLEPAEKAMTDDEWLMTEQREKPEDNSEMAAELASDSQSVPVSHEPSVINRSSSVPLRHQPLVISHPLPQPVPHQGCPGQNEVMTRIPPTAPLPSDQPLLSVPHGPQTGCPASSNASPQMPSEAHLLADPTLPRGTRHAPPATLPPNGPDCQAATQEIQTGWVNHEQWNGGGFAGGSSEPLPAGTWAAFRHEGLVLSRLSEERSA